MKKRTRRIQRPTLLQVHFIFAPIDRILDQLTTDGDIDVSESDEPVFRDEEGEWHATIPALNGWVELWERLAEKGRFDLNLEPLRILADKLTGELTDADVTAARAVVSECRRLFRGMDVAYVAGVVRTQQIAIELAGGET